MKPLSNVTRLRTVPEKLKVEQAENLKQALLPFMESFPASAMMAILRTISYQTTTDRKEAFIMLSPKQNRAVVNHLLKNSKRPMVAVELWAICFEHLYPDTGQILATQDELAKMVGDTPSHVSSIMGELEKFGAIFKKRVRITGVRGPGMVTYYMNPHVAEYGSRRSAEEIAQIPLPGFEPTVIQGGKT